MAKVSDIIEQARRRLGIQPAEEPLTAAEAEAARITLNSMLHAWAMEKTIASHADYTSLAADVSIEISDTLSVTDGATEALSACLAVRLCDDYGLPQPAAIVSHCQIGKGALAALKFTEEGNEPTSTFDSALLNVPSQRLIW